MSPIAAMDFAQEETEGTESTHHSLLSPLPLFSPVKSGILNAGHR